jgi:hypothetical protein
MKNKDGEVQRHLAKNITIYENDIFSSVSSMVFPSSFSLTLYVTASPSPTMRGLCSIRGPSNRTLWIKHPMDWSNATTLFLEPHMSKIDL